ncbi:MAG: AAA family ATPase [Planctomycetes bacterium]|nr:AAA family ATPase [Planctomycetota bacterium]
MASSSPAKRIFIAATGQDQGKTTVSLGLLAAFAGRGLPVGFIKPVGQRYVEIDGVRVDEDVELIHTIFPTSCELADMSPVTVGRSFTRRYIRDPQPEQLAERIRRSFQRVAEGVGLVVIEGTGHAGVGSCFDTSNADVARLLGADVILVTGGGIGRPIDEVLLNRALFADRGVRLMGVVLNKVLPAKLEEVREVVRAGLARKGIDLLGCVPYEPKLANPTVRQVLDEIGGRLLNGERAIGNSVESVIVGAMPAHRALEYIRPGCLLITPGDRDDLIIAAVSMCATGGGGPGRVAGILLTGGTAPQENVIRLVRRTDIPVMLVDEDSYTTAAAVNNLKVKIQPTDRLKTELAERLIGRYVDVGRIVGQL